MNIVAATLGVICFLYGVFHFASPKGMKAWLKTLAAFRDKNKMVFSAINILIGAGVLYMGISPSLDVLNVVIGAIFLIRGILFGVLMGGTQGWIEWINKNWAIAGFLALAVGFALFYLGMTEIYQVTFLIK